MKKSAVFAALLLFATPALAQNGTAGMGVHLETRLASVEDQIRALTGKVEQLDYAIRQMDLRLQRLQVDYEARLQKLETAPPPAAAATMPRPAPEPTPMSAPTPAKAAPETESGEPAHPDSAVSGTLGALKMKGEKVTGAVSNPKAPALPSTPEGYGLSAQEQYDRAFGLLRQANYEEAEKAFKSFIAKNPQDKLMDSAKYWYAETFYVRGKFNDAAVAFADAFQQNPKGTKAPDSLFKLGMALAALDKKQDACTTLGELKSKYPSAPASLRTRADQERQKLKCGK